MNLATVIENAAVQLPHLVAFASLASVSARRLLHQHWLWLSEECQRLLNLPVDFVTNPGVFPLAGQLWLVLARYSPLARTRATEARAAAKWEDGPAGHLLSSLGPSSSLLCGPGRVSLVSKCLVDRHTRLMVCRGCARRNYRPSLECICVGGCTI